MQIVEKRISVPREYRSDPVSHFASHVLSAVTAGETPIRLAVAESNPSSYVCSVGVVSGDECNLPIHDWQLFAFRRRALERCEKFTAVMIVPTGVGAEIGGHAGDATAAARVLASACDRVVVHPNIVNGSDINEMPENALYVEGSSLTRLLMGTVGLQPVRSNRVLAVIDDHPDRLFSDGAINSVSAARATLGLTCEVARLREPVSMSSQYDVTGRATGIVSNIDGLISLLADSRESYDAVALSSVISTPRELQTEYFSSDLVNPWGGVEALLSHAMSFLLDIPVAHAPMLEDREILDADLGIVDPRKAAEAISMAFLFSVLKGLHRSPKLVADTTILPQPGVVSAEDVSCIVVPGGCIGLPVLAACEQGIPVIAVRDNASLMKNELLDLPFPPGKLTTVDSYLEAAGVMACMKAGVSPDSVKRPLHATNEVRNLGSNELLTGDANERRSETSLGSGK